MMTKEEQKEMVALRRRLRERGEELQEANTRIARLLAALGKSGQHPMIETLLTALGQRTAVLEAQAVAESEAKKEVL